MHHSHMASVVIRGAGNLLFRWPSILLGMLSLSIGWGIRGNFGHEFGAMMPGLLCAVAVSLRVDPLPRPATRDCAAYRVACVPNA